MSNSPTTEPAVTSAPTAKRSPLAAYLLANPVAVTVAVVILITGLLFGTLWGRVPQSLAAGLLTTGALAHWWTPITALLIPTSSIDAVLVIALALTVLAYAERLLGSVRTVVLFFVTGALGVLLGVGLQALAVSVRETWAGLTQLDLVLDPTVGIVGVVMAASALAPALFRRRIRVIGFAALIMFALYAGDADSVYRLIGAFLGYLAGLLLARENRHVAWRRSSINETRTLVAVVVAVTGLGPLIVLLSGADRGPLAIIVSGFTPVARDDALARCATELTAACEAETALALTAGPGPFLLSLVPLLLGLAAAWGLRTGRRSAWVLGIVVNAALALLTALTFGAMELLDAQQTITVFGGEYYFWRVGAVLLFVAVVVLLAVTRRRFQVRAPRAAAVRFAAIVAVTFVILTVIHVVLSLSAPADFLDPPSEGSFLAEIARPFIPAAFLAGIPPATVPVSGFPLISFQWIGIIFWTVTLVALLLLYRATPTGRNTAEEERFRELLKEGGGGTLGFMGTWPGNDYWFSGDGNAAVAYRVINGVALTMSDPVACGDDDARVIREFVDYCDAQGWSAVFYSFHERYLPVLMNFGWQYVSVGEETVIDLPNLELVGKPWQKVRTALNKGKRAGMTTLWTTWDDLPTALSRQIEAISEQWVAEKELPEMGFTLGGIEEIKDPDVALFLAINPEGGLEAVTSWLPSWTNRKVTGWTLDFMRRGDGSMPGVMEFVIASAALNMKELGAEVMSLSAAPLAAKPLAAGEEPPESTVVTRLLDWLGGVLEPAYGFTSLFRFKSKFNPRYETIYMAYADPTSLPTIGLAIGKAYLPEVTPREYVALGRTLTGSRND